MIYTLNRASDLPIPYRIFTLFTLLYQSPTSDLSLHLPGHLVKVLKTELPSHKTRSHPFEPRRAQHLYAVGIEPLGENCCFYCMRAEEEVEQSILDPRCVSQVLRASERLEDLATGGEGHDDAADYDGLEVGSCRRDVCVSQVFGRGGRHCELSVVASPI